MAHLEIPATAGQILTEERLRAFTKCSQFYHYGGELKESTLVHLLRETLEYMVAKSLRHPIVDPQKKFTVFLNTTMNRLRIRDDYTEGEVMEFERKGIYFFTNFWRLFNPKFYVPVAGQTSFKAKISKTPVELKVAALFRHRARQTLHAIDFPPFSGDQNRLNDPISPLKVLLLKQFVKKHRERPQATLHMVWSLPGHNIGHRILSDTDIPNHHLKMIRSVVELMEQGYHYPLVPCFTQCTFKSICHPHGLKTK